MGRGKNGSAQTLPNGILIVIFLKMATEMLIKLVQLLYL